MNKLKDFYVEMGHDYDRLENSLWYLSELSLYGAIEIDNHLLGRNPNFSHIQELAGILKRYQLKDTDTALPLTEPHFPYRPLWKAVRKNLDKDVRWISELALEMKLLRSELEDVPTNSKRLEELRSLLCDFSKGFSTKMYQYRYLNHLVA